LLVDLDQALRQLRVDDFKVRLGLGQLGLCLLGSPFCLTQLGLGVVVFLDGRVQLRAQLVYLLECLSFGLGCGDGGRLGRRGFA
jgi:hypothetical protein